MNNIPLNIDWQQILLHLFNFIILFAILYFLLYSPVKKFMDDRQKMFKDMEDKANADIKKAEELKAEYEGKLDAVADEIAEMKKKARTEAEAAAQQKLAGAEREADKLIENAKASIERDRAKMVSDAKNEISEIVTDAVEKIVSGSDTLTSYDTFLDTVKRGDSNE